ncbi:MAG: MBL fold metallo-hydrolase [Conexivisphaera sp.]|jgi:putative mRNA 3-end processing factor
MRIRVLGAAREVGRSAVLVEQDGSRILMDYGVSVGTGRNKDPAFPIHVRPRDVGALVITHAHLDHSGAAPLFEVDPGRSPAIYATSPTVRLSELLLHDFVKVTGDASPFTDYEVAKFAEDARAIDYGEDVRVGDLTFRLTNAGHVPGSAMIYVEGSRRVLYTGDMNRSDTELLRGYGDGGPLPEADVVVAESTYSQTQHPSRDEEERALVEYAKEVVERKGTLLIPAFAVGRAQEVAMALRRHRFPHRVYMDGMALKVNELMTSIPDYVRDPEALEDALNSLEYVNSWGMRKRIVEEPGVIISPAGMLVGGASIFYSKRISEGDRNGVAIVAYQAPETPGRKLLDKGELEVPDEGKKRRVKAEVRRFDFSSHSGRDELLKFFTEDIRGDPLIILVHGDEEPMLKFAEELRGKGLKVEVPTAGQEFEIGGAVS